MEYAVAQQGVYDAEGAAPASTGGALDTAADALRLNRLGVLRDLAESTGGFLVAETNDLRPGLDRVAADLRSYYEVAYAAPAGLEDGRWHAITVKMARPGVTGRTRKGYYAFPRGAPVIRSGELPLVMALEASPLPANVEHHLAVLRLADAGTQPQLVVTVEVPLATAAIVKDESAGLWRAHLQLLGHVKDDKGQHVARLTHDASLEGPLDEAEGVRRRNLIVRRVLRLGSGRYTLETAVQDWSTGKLGARRFAFEVPSASGLSLGNVAIVRADEASAALAPGATTGADEAGELLRVGTLRATPVLGKTFPRARRRSPCS